MSCMREPFATAARLAAGQHGRVSGRQLVHEGVDRRQIERWLADGRLLRVHHGVYAVGHRAPSVRGDYMAAVLACGDGAVLSYRAAAHLLRLLSGGPPLPEVTVPTLGGRTRPGIVIHRVADLPALDASEVERIPIATVPRVLLDIAPSTAPKLLTRACHMAWVHHETGLREVEACIARNPTKPGIAKLRRAIGADATLSDLEDAFLALLREHGLPLPRTNVDQHGDKVDCHWPDMGLTVELLSFRYHGTRAAFEADVGRRRRSNHIAYAFGDVFERGDQTIADLRQRMAKVSKPATSTVVTTRSSTVA
jgi:hypothetical protein